MCLRIRDIKNEIGLHICIWSQTWYLHIKFCFWNLIERDFYTVNLLYSIIKIFYTGWKYKIMYFVPQLQSNNAFYSFHKL